MSAPTTSVDAATQFIGQLDEDGIANLEEDPTHTKRDPSRPTRSLKAVLVGTDSDQTGADNGSESTSEEDYDSLKHDPLTVVSGGRGGGYGEIDDLDTRQKSYEEIRPSSGSRPNVPRRKSIPIKLNKLEEKGQYLLTADDAALTEILKIGLEREKTGSAKKGQKFRDLVFTRQFTAFDRQNVESADSPFHGFFTLFW